MINIKVFNLKQKPVQDSSANALWKLSEFSECESLNNQADDTFKTDLRVNLSHIKKKKQHTRVSISFYRGIL